MMTIMAAVGPPEQEGEQSFRQAATTAAMDATAATLRAEQRLHA